MKKLLLILPVVILLAGCGNVSNGSHTGYVTAIEKNGLIWKTGNAYFKTSLESTQEDYYCVEDEDVYKKLEEASREKRNITISFSEEIIVAPWRCGGSTVIITNVN